MRVTSTLALVVAAGVLAIATAGLLADTVVLESGPSDERPPNSSVDSRLLAEESSETVACPPGSGGTAREPVDAPTIVELYPNPTTENDVGEYAVLETRDEVDVGNWTLTDGHAVAEFPNETVDGRAALTTDADATAALTDEEPLELDGYLRFAADGDALELRDGDEVIDSVAYERAPSAEIWYRSDDRAGRGTWWPRGATCAPPAAGGARSATAFVLPDAPEVPLETIRDADDRILLAGYTFTSETVATELLEAADRGVTVRVLVESSPVGGTPAETEPVLADLEAGGVDVRATGGEGSRYDFHHPKYAVVDETVLITTENWKPTGIGGAGSRGWGVALEDPELAAALADVFRADFEGWDTESGETFRERATFVDDERPDRSYAAEHEPETVAVESTELLVAPDNAEGRLLELLAGAEGEVLVKQASLGGTDVSLVEATVDAARRGVDVRILLDSTWYVEAENRAVAAELEDLAAEEDLSIEVELVDPDGRFEKIHAKGVVIDGETAVVGSANWNRNALENNREVLLVLHGEEAAAYYAAVFEDDWDGASWPLPVGFAAAVVATLVGAAFVGSRYVRFGGEPRPSSEPGEQTPAQGRIGDAPITVVPAAGDDATASADSERTPSAEARPRVESGTRTE